MKHPTPVPYLGKHPCRQRGVSLIIVLIMLVIIGLTSAATMRNATSNEQLTNNMRMQNLAQQYAEAALRYCEAQLVKPDSDEARVATLKEAKIVVTPVDTELKDVAWMQTVTWTGTGGASASLTSLPEAIIKSSDTSFNPAKLPECVVEKQMLRDGTRTYVITGRGFSPDYTADASTGSTTGGSVVWLQSTLVLN
ncbi:PilX N-terminal domain-containing pilus assembly protein [Polaromonas sp.]|uniref:pilus assembly PilX family protein n=1 Tax=Polaromonas sp. TaxID=1869339 RepID=UPI003267FA2B